MKTIEKTTTAPTAKTTDVTTAGLGPTPPHSDQEITRTLSEKELKLVGGGLKSLAIARPTIATRKD